MAFLAGAYIATYNGLAVGQLSEGITTHMVTYKEIITGDQLGRAAQDAVFQGSDVTSDFIMMEWNALAALQVFMPYTTNATFLTNGVVGRLDQQQGISKTLLLTAIAGPPAAGIAGSRTISLPWSILHEDFPVDTIMRSAHRKIPIRMRHYPDPTVFANTNGALYGNVT